MVKRIPSRTEPFPARTCRTLLGEPIERHSLAIMHTLRAHRRRIGQSRDVMGIPRLVSMGNARRKTRERLEALLAEVEQRLAGEIEEAQVQAALAEAVQRAVEGVVPKLLREALNQKPRVLRRRRRFRRGFEKRLRKRWGDALDLYDLLMTWCVEWGGAFNDRYREEAAADDDFAFEALTRLHARACLTASEIHVLLQTGHAVGAEARWRTLHEITVVSFILARRDRDIAERYLNHELIEQASDAEEYQRYHERLRYEPIEEAELERLRDLRATLVSRFGRPFARGHYGWAAPLFVDRSPEFGDIEEMAGIDHLRPFRTLGTRRVHAGAHGTGLGVLHRGPHQMLQAGPTNFGLADAGHGALGSLVQCTITLLLQGRPEPDDVLWLVRANALLELLDRSGDAFLAAHRRLEADEARLWSKAADSLPED
jgi:hypothetical protein